MKAIDSLHRSILTGASLSLAIRVAGVLLMFLAHILLARSLADHQYGVFAYAISVVPILALVAKCGFEFSGLRFLHQYDGRDADLMAGFLRRSWQIPLLVSLVIVVCVVAMGLLLPDLPDIVSETAKYAPLIVIVFSLASIAQQLLRAMKRIVYSQLFEQIGLPLALIAYCLGILAFEEAAGHQSALAVYGLAYLGIAIVCWKLVTRNAGIDRRTTRRYDTLGWLKVSLPLAIVGMAGVLSTRLDIILLGFYFPPPEIAMYTVSSRIAGLSIFVMAAISAISGPYLSEFFHDGKIDQLALLLRKTVALAGLASVAIWLALWVAGDYLLLAFGEQYVPFKPVMLVLAAGRLADVGLTLGGQLLSVSGHHRQYMLLLIAMTAVLAGALYPAIIAYGPMGAAIATSAVLIVTNLLVFVLIRRHLGIRVLGRG